MPHDTERCNPDAELCGVGMAEAESCVKLAYGILQISSWKKPICLFQERVMRCAVCMSANLVEFPTEMAMHFPSGKNLVKPPVLIFPKVLLCLDCGFSEFTVPKTELRLLREVHARTNSAQC
jgi:hypothetical protein